MWTLYTAGGTLFFDCHSVSRIQGDGHVLLNRIPLHAAYSVGVMEVL
jgi:hypothetical protein